MSSRADVWAFAAHFFSEQLAVHWDKITIGGKSIEQAYGLTRETCNIHQIGFAPADTNLLATLQSALKIDSEELIANSGYGLTRESQNVFNGRLIFPFIQRDKPIYFSGRATDLTPAGDPTRNAKYLHGKLEAFGINPDERPLYLDPEYNRLTILTEGFTHALRLRQEGFAAVAICGAVPNGAQTKLLRRCEKLTWLPDVDILAPEEARFAQRDGHKQFIPAVTKEEKLARLLQALDTIPRCRVARYPEEFCAAHDHGDVTDWFLEHPGPAEFIALLDAAADRDSLLIESIPPDSTSAERSDRIESLLDSLAERSPLEQAELLSRLRNHLQLGNDQIAHLRRELKTRTQKSTRPVDDASDFSAAAGVSPLRLGQDFKNGDLLYTVWKRVRRPKHKGGNSELELSVEPYIITSSGDFFPCTSPELLKHKLMLMPGCRPSIPTFHWSDDEKIPYSLPTFIRNPQQSVPDTAALYADLRAFLERYIYLEQPEYYDFLALFIMCSYCVSIFSAIGLLALRGTKATGKSQVLDCLEATGFNPIRAASCSDSFLFRSVDTLCGMVLFDEAEVLHSSLTVNNQVSEKSLLLQACYTRSGTAGRCIGTDNDPYTFRTFGTYALANTRGYNPTLMDRVFHLAMVKAQRDVSYFDHEHVAEETGSIRNRLHCWFLSHARAVAKMFARVTIGDLVPFMDYIGLRQRERQLWAPLFSVALTIDDLMNRPFTFDLGLGQVAPIAHETLAGNILEAQHALGRKKQEIQLLQDPFTLMIACLRQMLLHHELPTFSIATLPDERRHGWYKVSEIIAYLNKHDGLLNFPKKRGQNSLRPLLLHNLVISAEDSYRWKGPQDSDRHWYIRLNPENVQKVCALYQVPDDAFVEVAEGQSIGTAEQQELAAESTIPLDETHEPQNQDL